MNDKLKTLKDINGTYGRTKFGKEKKVWVDFEELKAEAIKWVKDIRNSVPSTSKKKEDIRCFSESFIKHFFNITEGDLK